MFFGRIANRLEKINFFLLTCCEFKKLLYVYTNNQKQQPKTTIMKMTKICAGVYQTEWNGHIIQISNESEWVEGPLVWAITSETLDLGNNEGGWDTLYITKAEALYMLPYILRTAKKTW